MCAQHPGLKIQEKLNEFGMSRKELASRTNVSEKHICTIISGDRDITASFAQKLGYVFEGCGAQYWQNLQNTYDLSVLREKEKNNITNKEEEALDHLEDIIQYLKDTNVIRARSYMTVIDLLHNLTYIKNYKNSVI